MRSQVLLTLMLVVSFCGMVCTTNGISSTKDEITSASLMKIISKGKDVVFKDKIITGDLDFSSLADQYLESKSTMRVQIESSITLVNCVFQGHVVATKTDTNGGRYAVTFGKNLVFLDCEFQKEVNFSDVVVWGAVNFSGSLFRQKTSFEGAVFQTNDVYFNNTTFQDEVRCQRLWCNGNLNFLHANFQGITSFQQAIVRGLLQFGDAQFVKYTDFGSMQVHEGVFFNAAAFNDRVQFNNSIFAGRIEFIASRFISDAQFRNIIFNGRVQFSKAEFRTKFTLENSVFNFGKPETDNIVKYENTEIILDNAIYNEFKQIQLNDF